MTKDPKSSRGHARRKRKAPSLGWPLVFLLLLLGACDSNPSSTEQPETRTLVFLTTNDEHGWIEESEETDGAARLMGLWRSAEGYDEDGDFLILSAGDNWTGPAISTWFEGESTVEVMNAMGYSASAIGNHEFDFTVDVLRERITQADFPYLAANIRTEGTGAVPDFATPFIIKNVNGIRVGVVGLASRSTPWTTFPTYVEDYEFTAYDLALEESVPQAWNAGADLVVVVGHICRDEILDLLPTIQALGVSAVAGGHCHEFMGEVRDGVALVIGGWRFDAYGRVELGFDPEERRVTSVGGSFRMNTGGTPDPAVQSIVTTWQQAAEAELSEVIGYAEATIPDESPALYNLIMDSWLFEYPTADIAMTNAGGVRQGIPAGDISLGTIVGVLPFQNNLVALELTGSEVVACLKSSTLVAGMTTTGGYRHADGTFLKMDSTYHVLTTDYLYALDGYDFDVYDPTPYPTGIVYFQPTADYIESLETSPSNPLDDYLDHTPRR
jgi:2',3'-cyclic-nucleotide 2'-phosphodiesterase (5'-nucleotidase family)